MDLCHNGVEAMPKPESFPIDKIYVPVKKKKAILNSFKRSRKVFWKSDNKRPFSFDPPKAASFWLRDYIGSKPAKRLAKQLSSGSWSLLSLGTKGRFCPPALKQKQ